MTPNQIQMIVDLYGCTFLPGSFEKRFVKSLLARAAKDPNKPLSDRQANYMYQLYHMYRNQIGKVNHNIRCVLCNKQLEAK